MQSAATTDRGEWETRARERERVGSGKRERARVPGRRCVEGGVAGQSLGGTSRRSQPATVTEVPSGTVLLCSRVGPGGVRVREPVSGAAVRRLGTVWGRLGPVGAGVPGASRFLASGVRGGTGQGGAPRWRRTRRDHAATGGRHQSPSQRTSTSGIGGRPGGVARLHWRAPELPGGVPRWRGARAGGGGAGDAGGGGSGGGAVAAAARPVRDGA